MRDSVSLCLGMTVALVAGASASAQYSVGETWARKLSWTAGTHGTTINNPSPDQKGNDVWSYEYASGGGLGSSNPWFGESTTLMTWDNSWWKTGQSVWSRGNNFSPPIMSERLIHTLSLKSSNTMPIVRWTSPIAQPSYIGVTGDLTIGWQGMAGSGFQADVEVVIAVVDSASGSVTPLYTTVVIKPSASTTQEFLTLPIALGGIHVDLGDSLIFTHRAQAGALPSGWISMYDKVNVTLAQVPAPATGALAAMLGLAMTRRRR